MVACWTGSKYSLKEPAGNDFESLSEKVRAAHFAVESCWRGTKACQSHWVVVQEEQQRSLLGGLYPTFVDTIYGYPSLVVVHKESRVEARQEQREMKEHGSSMVGGRWSVRFCFTDSAGAS